jgi:predicted metal-dependent HD superfamily phosphohydrolase
VHWPDQERWLTLCQALGASTAGAGWYERLTDAYAAPQRYYHNQQHIAECLQEFDQVRHLAQQSSRLEMAIWFHDAVYDPRAPDNEEQSAALAKQCLLAAGTSDPLAKTVVQLVMATKHHDVNAGADARLMVDIDLSILGRDEARFFEYEEQSRKEYAWVSETVFAPKRAEILEGFLSRDPIYATDWFRNKYEGQARKNLAASIGCLRRKSR